MRALVISIRGLHAGYLGCYGNEWITTPAVDRLAVEGVVFDRHLADVPDPAAARRAWRSGRYQLPALEPEEGESPPGPDLLEELRRGAVRTVLVADGSQPVPEDFTTGWDEVEVVSSLSGEATFLEQTLETARAALQRLASVDRWLLWIDLGTLLPPWEVPAEFSDPYFEEMAEEEGEAAAEEDDEWEEEESVEEFEDEGYLEEPEEGEALEEEFEEIVEEDEEEDAGELIGEEEEEEQEPITPWFDPEPCFIDPEDDVPFLRLQASYASAVSFLDAGVDALLEELAGLGLSDGCLVMLVGDHGQALGEHGVVGPHRPWLHEELVHTPLLLRLPATLANGRETGGGRAGALTQAPDLMPTLLDAFSLSCPERVQGHSLLQLAREEVEQVRDYACSGLKLGEAAEWSLRTLEWAYLVPAPLPDDPPRNPRLHVKPDDRWEVNDILQHHLELAEGLERTLREFVAAARQPGPLEPPGLPDLEAEEEAQEATEEQS